MILITVGRNPNNKICLNHQSVSGFHAEVKVRDDASISIIDKSSTNGTFVKGQKIKTETEVAVNRGEKISFAGVADLDWNKVPVIVPPSVGWKIYSFGTDLNNRIQIFDPLNQISRFHATLKINTQGKYFINDHSSNGTWVNGTRIPSNQDYPLKRKDKILFSNSIPLDWAKVAEPQTIKPIYYLAPIAAVLIVALLIFGYKKGLLPGGKMSPEQIAARYEKAVVCVAHNYQIVAELYDDDGNEYDGNEIVLKIKDGKLLYVKKGDEEAANYIHEGYGTAFFIDKNGTMLTNRHITIPWEEEIKKFEFLNKDSKIKRVYGETVFIGIAFNNTDLSKLSDFMECSILSGMTDDSNKDVGLLRTKDRKLPGSTTSFIDINNAVTDANELKVGQFVYLMGYPMGVQMFGMTSSGTTNSIQVRLTNQQGTITQAPDKYKFGHNAASFGGASGSPILNDKGQLIGIHNAGLSQKVTQGFNWGILAKHGKELYDKEIR